MADSRLGTLIMVFIVILVGVALLGSIADNIFITNNPEVVLNEQVVITGGIAVINASGFVTFREDQVLSLANDKIFTIDAVKINGTVLTSVTDFDLDAVAGKFTLNNGSTLDGFNMSGNPANITLWNYTHGDNFVQDSVSRTFLNLIPLFFVLGIVLLVLAGIFKDSIIDLIGKR